MAELPAVDIKKVPTWVWIAAGGGALIGLYLIIRNASAASATAQGSATAGGGGLTDALAAVTGFQQQVSGIQQTLQAEIDKLTSDQQGAINTLASSINTSITNITGRLTELANGQATLTTTTQGLSTQIAGALAQIANLGRLQTNGSADAYIKFQAYNQIITQLEAQIQALTKAVGSGATLQALLPLLSSYVIGNYKNELGLYYNVNIGLDGLISAIKAHPSIPYGPNYKKVVDFLLSLTKDANGNYVAPASADIPALTAVLPTLTAPPAP